MERQRHHIKRSRKTIQACHQVPIERVGTRGFQRPGRGQSNASELTIARSDQLRGCWKKGSPAVRDQIFTPPAIWRCLVVATSALCRTWANVEKPLDPLLKGPMCVSAWSKVQLCAIYRFSMVDVERIHDV